MADTPLIIMTNSDRPPRRVWRVKLQLTRAIQVWNGQSWHTIRPTEVTQQETVFMVTTDQSKAMIEYLRRLLSDVKDIFFDNKN